MTTTPTELPGIATRHFAEFQCIGSACESTCCSGWRVDVDRAAYHRLRARLKADGDDPSDYFTAPGPRPRHSRRPADETFAQMKRTADGDCSALEDDGLCGLHRRFGAGALPSTCATFPRRVSYEQGDGSSPRLRATLDLGCPEAARLCLLRPDSMQTVRLRAGDLPSQRVETLPVDIDAWHVLRDDVTARFRGLLTTESIPLRVRLGLIGVFAHRTGPAFRPGGGPEGVDALQEAWRHLTQGDALAIHLEAIGAMHPGPRFGASVAASLVIGEKRLAPAGGPTLASLLLGDDLRGAVVGYGPRRDWWMERHGPAIDALFTRWLDNHLWTHPYWLAASLRRAVGSWLVRYSALRLALFSQPVLARVADQGVELQPDDARARLESAAVHVVHKTTRQLAPREPLVRQLVTTLVNQGELEVPHLLTLGGF